MGLLLFVQFYVGEVFLVTAAASEAMTLPLLPVASLHFTSFYYYAMVWPHSVRTSLAVALGERVLTILADREPDPYAIPAPV